MTIRLAFYPLFGILGDALRRYDTGLTSAPTVTKRSETVIRARWGALLRRSRDEQGVD
ncbi:hypothetical protein BO443_40200 [Burkholderia orbicola]